MQPLYPIEIIATHEHSILSRATIPVIIRCDLKRIAGGELHGKQAGDLWWQTSNSEQYILPMAADH